MQLKLKRSQRSAGLMGGKLLFVLDARAYLSPDEEALIKKYNLGGELVYDSEERKQSEASRKQHAEAAAAGKAVLYHVASTWVARAMAGLKLRITIDTLTKGEHIECKSMGELLGAEDAMIESCDNVKTYLATAQTFDGRESVFEF